MRRKSIIAVIIFMLLMGCSDKITNNYFYGNPNDEICTDADIAGDDVFMWKKEGVIKIHHYSNYQTEAGKEALENSKIPDGFGDFNCWDKCGEPVQGAIQDDVLTIRLKKFPGLLNGVNRFNAGIGSDWTQLQLFSQKDKDILIRMTSQNSSTGKGDLVMAIYLSEDGTVSPVPENMEVVAR